MAGNETGNLYEAIRKSLLYATALIIVLWLSYKILSVILLLLLALVLVIIINAPVAWLEKKNIKRGWACVIVFGSIALIIFLLGWLVLPKISAQFSTLINNLPLYASQLSKNVASWFSNYPEVSREIEADGSSFSKWMPSLPKALLQIGNFSLSVLGLVLIVII